MLELFLQVHRVVSQDCFKGESMSAHEKKWKMNLVVINVIMFQLKETQTQKKVIF